MDNSWFSINEVIILYVGVERRSCEIEKAFIKQPV